MPTLSRPHRRVLATLVVVAGLMLPTLCVAGLAWHLRQPSHLRDAESEIGRRLGLQVSLEGVRYPRPGDVEYRGIVLKQPEPRSRTVAEVARASALRLHRGGRDLQVRAEGLWLRGESPRQAMEQVSGLLRGTGDLPWDRVSLLVPSCVIELGDSGPSTLRYRLRDVAGAYQADRGAPTISASYRVLDEGASTRCEVTLTRNRQGRSVRNVLTFAAKDGLPMPAAVLAPFLDASAWLGPRAKVWGTLALRESDGSDWEGEFRGQFTDVDLAALVGRRFADHRLEGLARVEIRSARWGDRGPQGFGWIDAEGTLISGPGTISRSLLDALGRQLAFRSPTSIAPLGPDLAFQALGLGFTMAADGSLRFRGDLGPEFPHDAVLVESRRGVPLFVAPRGPGDVRGLVKALFPTATGSPDVLVPGTPESQSVQRYLPLPPSLVSRLEHRSSQ